MARKRKITGATKVSINEFVEGLKETDEMAAAFLEVAKDIEAGMSEEKLSQKYRDVMSEERLDNWINSKFVQIFVYIKEHTDGYEHLCRLAGYSYLIDAEMERLNQK